MSLYLVKKELLEFLNSSNLKFKLKNKIDRTVATVVYKNNKKKFLDFDNYSEENLKELVKDEKRVVYVDLEFWNYNYCKKSNIDKEAINSFIENLGVVVESASGFSEGTITVLIILHEMLLNTYKIKDLKVFKDYLDNFKISKRVIRNFLINMEYSLPLTKNYLELIKKVFDSENICRFIFNKANEFTVGEVRTIFNHFKVENIHESCSYVWEKNKDTRKTLQYICALLEIFDGIIDTASTVYTNKQEPHLGYYLLDLEVEKENEACFFTIIQKYLDKDGAIDIRLDKDKEKTKKLMKRSLEIKDYLDRS